MTSRGLAGLFLAAAAHAQLPVGSHLSLVSRSAVGNLSTIEAVCSGAGSCGLGVGLPNQLPLETLIGVAGACADGQGGAHCHAGAYLDATGFLWVLDANHLIAKLVPPPTLVGGRLVFSIDTNDLGQREEPLGLVFDGNGDALVLLIQGHLGSRPARLVRVDATTGALTTEHAFVTPPHLENSRRFSLKLLRHSNGNLYYQGADRWLYRLRRNGAQYLETRLFSMNSGATCGTEGFGGLAESYDGRLLALGVRGLCGSTPVASLLELDESTGAVLRSTGLPVGSGDDLYAELFALPMATGGVECWLARAVNSGSTPAMTSVARTMLRPGQGFTPVITQAAGPVSAEAPIGFGVDGTGRVYHWSRSWTVFFDRDRVAVQGQFGSGGVFGDPSGMRRALSGDRNRDEDGDGFSNWLEGAARSNPFDRQQTPTARPPSLFVTPSAAIGDAFTVTLQARPSSSFLLAGATGAMPPLSFPGFVGGLELAPAIHVFFTTFGTPFVVAPNGLFALTMAVPSNPALHGAVHHFQAVTLNAEPAQTGFSNRTTFTIL